MPDIAIEALSAIGSTAGEVAAGAGEALGAAGEFGSGLLGAGEGALSGVFSAGEPFAAAGGEALSAAETGLSGAAGGAGSSLDNLFGFASPAAEAGGAGGSQALGFTQDISQAGFVMPDGQYLPGPAEALAGGPAAAAGAGGTELSALTGTGSSLEAAGAGGGSLGGGVAQGATDPLAGAAGGSGGGFFDKLGTSALNSITKNPLGTAAAGVGLGYSILNGSKTSQNEQNVQNIANGMAGQGQQLQQYLQNGTLPPGMQAGLDNAKAAAKAQIISGYAARGQPADPNMNSALAQELAAVDTNSLELQGKIATNLLQAGINETNMSANLFQALIQMDATQAKSMGAAISNFATALAGGPKAIVLGGGATA